MSNHQPARKKGPKVGSGGVRRRRLEGRGPTPKAVDREYHPAYAKKKAKEEQERKAEAIKIARAGGKLPSYLKLEPGHELIVGRNAVVEAVRADVPLTRVFIVSGAVDERMEEAAREAADRGAPVIEVSRGHLDVMTEKAAHQGIAIEVPPYDYTDIDTVTADIEASGRTGLILALDSITDPHNLGAVLRSASAFDADAVLITERRSASVNATVWKVSAGAAARVPVARETNLVRTLNNLKSRGYFIVGLAGEGDVILDDLELADMPLVLVTGSEGRGLSRLVRDTCDQVCSIPISGEMESLNAAVATGIALYEVDRRRRKAGQ
ncbi:23S rRNA (guanosine(2251)-2'-O)-methyltransferase RlmB [Flaviflexus salsibiostraticola]|uniref:23S rRNA (Guanosine(2251)-2'-O)-methyltransferase RlmB n=1 Tax=Flaviflexus salsibiostraticola TaxID=1282737 RepID=A0A3S8ZAI7_9ACTO|nr:23S rRNA (guanosine(2251)-2'-O)-methyltransferase RlmB [Flaviflexus salsibiostraticola]AZN30486.1 23S rRNA (guanosine(2251)-2'-O)-methyltransferase RlmB [Flaviflexus salsibiostraticola]